MAKRLHTAMQASKESAAVSINISLLVDYLVE